MSELDQRLKRLRQQYPFLFIDRILDFQEGQSCRAIKNVSFNEKFFLGHFRGEPLLPGVLLIEMMAQTAALIGDRDGQPQSGVLAKVEQVKFLRTTQPGDQLIIEARIERRFGPFQKFKGTVHCGDKLVAKGTFVVASKQEESQ